MKGPSSVRSNGAGRGRSRPSGHAAGSSAIDKPLLMALGALVGVYTVVTVLTYYKVSSSNVLEQQQHVASSANSDRIGAVVPPDTQNKALNYIQQLQQTFPIHVGDDTEVIPHPGLALIDPNNIPKGLPTTMTVPKFFDESHGHFYFDNVKSKKSHGSPLSGQRRATDHSGTGTATLGAR